MPRYALLTYKAHPEYNVGDYIQSLAAAQYLPQVDYYISREKLNSFQSDHVKLIMNGWFMHHPQNWPPSNHIDPLLVSFHLNSQARSEMLGDKGLEWFRAHAPIGCRDLYTLSIFREAGIDAYQSGCLTTTFKNNWNYRTDDIYFVDVLFRVPDWTRISSSAREFARSVLSGDFLRGSQRQALLRKIFTEDLLRRATFLNHYHPARHTEQERFQMAECFLEKYATAKLVVTSRLHCALPCLAFGTPVIFVEAGFNQEQDWCRFNGITDLFNTITVEETGNIISNFERGATLIGGDVSLPVRENHKTFIPILEEACTTFVNEVSLPL